MFSLHMMSDLEPFFLMIYSLIVDNIHLLTSGAVDVFTNISQGGGVTELASSPSGWEVNAFGNSTSHDATSISKDYANCLHCYRWIESTSSTLTWNCARCNSGPHSHIWDCIYCHTKLCLSCATRTY